MKSSEQRIECNLIVNGQLGAEFSAWFEGLELTSLGGGNTRIAGIVTDQSMLYGLLEKCRDLGLALLSVHTRPAQE